VPVPPPLGVVAFHPQGDRDCADLRDAAAAAGLELSLLRLPAGRLNPGDRDAGRILRAVFMKAGQQREVPRFVELLDRTLP
jgi:hypothetical protein